MDILDKETNQQIEYVPPKFKIIFLDEAQDLSLIQWNLD